MSSDRIDTPENARRLAERLAEDLARLDATGADQRGAVDFVPVERWEFVEPNGTDPERVEVEPALTPAEWKRIQRAPGGTSVLGTRFLARLLEAERPAGAAAALLQESGPDGGPLFTREHVERLRWLAGTFPQPRGSTHPDAAWLGHFADLLTSILPPVEDPGDATS